MSYSVKEVFFSLQGEGAQTGRPAVFLRFTGCNLWSGLERDRGIGLGSCARWCDTDFVGTNGGGGGKFADAFVLSRHVRSFWPGGGKPYVVCTGGEPSLQLDIPLLNALQSEGFEIAVETNGTHELPAGVDWICVSPKAAAALKVRAGDELKVVFPQPELPLEEFESLNFRHFFVQPMDGPRQQQNVSEAVAFCLANPKWRLSLQTHKSLGLR